MPSISACAAGMRSATQAGALSYGRPNGVGRREAIQPHSAGMAQDSLAVDAPYERVL